MNNFFSFDRGGSGSGNYWNYNHPEKDGYSPTIIGRLVELSDPPSTKFESSEIDRWDDGNPKRNIRMAIVDGAGNEWLWDFAPGGKARPSMAMLACANALTEAGIQGTGVEDLLGRVISVTTKEPPQGFSYGRNAPRPWEIHIVDATVGEHRGTKHVIDPVTEGQPQAPQPQAPAPMPAPANVMQAAQQAANAMGFQQPQQQAPAPAPMQAPAPMPMPMNGDRPAPDFNQVPVGAYGI